MTPPAEMLVRMPAETPGVLQPDEPLHAEESLVAAVIEYERLYQFLRRMEKQAARQIMNQVDVNMPTGPQRDTVRTQVMDALAQQRREIMSWIRGTQVQGD